MGTNHEGIKNELSRTVKKLIEKMREDILQDTDKSDDKKSYLIEVIMEVLRISKQSNKIPTKLLQTQIKQKKTDKQ